MEKAIAVTNARGRFRTIVDEVQFEGVSYVVSRHGRPAAALVPIQVYENWKQQRKRLLELIEQVGAANPDAGPDDVIRDVLAAQQQIRAQQ